MEIQVYMGLFKRDYDDESMAYARILTTSKELAETILREYIKSSPDLVFVKISLDSSLNTFYNSASKKKFLNQVIYVQWMD